MGTSKDYSGATGGGWSGFKRAATRLATGGVDPVSVRNVGSRYVEALGGSRAAAATATAGTRTAARVGNVLDGIAGNGLTPTLQELGLGEFIGCTPLELVAAMSAELAGDGSTLEDAAALDAVVFMLEGLYVDAGSFEDAEAIVLDAAGVRNGFTTYMARYVYKRMLPLLNERLVQRGDAADAARVERQVWEYTLACARDELADVDVVGLDWQGSDAQAIAEDLMRGVFAVFGDES
jgi:hypothetical protein